jgi:PAS domain S-box-containing protein
MKGALSEKSSGGGIRFYRVISLCGVVGSALFFVFFVLMLPSEKELIWDRILVFIYCSYVSIYGFKKDIDAHKYITQVYIGYYLITTQAIISCALSNFQPFNFLILFIISQICAYSFRQSKETLIYLIYICIANFLCLYFISDISNDQMKLFTFFLLGATFFQYATSKIKADFIFGMKLKQDLLRSLITKTETAILLTDEKGRIIDVNPRSAELFGYSKEEIIDQDFKMFRKAELNTEEVELGLNELHQNKFWITEASLVRKDKSEIFARISITMISTGGKQYPVYRVDDITAIKNYQGEILAAKENAEDATKAKGQFLAVMSHEIRTPLNGVIATASLLHQTSLNTEQRDYVDIIKKSGNNLLMLINDILEFSKMENGKMQLDLQPSDISEIVTDVVDLLRSPAESKGLVIYANVLNSIPPRLMVDGFRLRQIILNLLGNAIKFTGKGQVEVSCNEVLINKNKVKLSFEIKDTGIGIPKDKQHLLFQSFTQVDSSTSRKFGGTGLGLSISKELIELMGGNITLESEYGKGSTFRFFIHCEIAENEDKHSGATLEKTYSDNKGLKVLIAEDNPINQQVLRQMMTNIGAVSEVVDDGSKVEEAILKEDFDVIFMDMQMPEMDGIQATLKVRALNIKQPIIIAISANAYSEDRQDCINAGMNDFLSKPFNLDQLKSILQKWIHPSGSIEQAA